MEHQVIITVGDWSEDGHNKYDIFSFNSSHSREQLQRAYWNSCKTSGIKFHGDGGINQVCVDWKDSLVNCYQLMMLHRTFRLDISNIPDIVKPFSMNGFHPSTIDFAKLVLWFAGKSLVGFTHGTLEKIPKNSRKENNEFYDRTFNGWWSNTLNEHMGYGLWDNYSDYVPTKHYPLEGKLHFVGKESRILPAATMAVRYLPFVDMSSDFIYDLRYNKERIPTIKEWANDNLKGNLFKFGNRYFFEEDEDIEIFSEKFITDTYLEKILPYRFQQFRSDSTEYDKIYKFFDENDEKLAWCQKTFGDPLWRGQKEMPNPNLNGKWAVLHKRTLYLTKEAAVAFKLRWDGITYE